MIIGFPYHQETSGFLAVRLVERLPNIARLFLRSGLEAMADSGDGEKWRKHHFPRMEIT